MVKPYMGGVTFQLVFSVFVAGTGSGFQHGYSTGVVNAPQHIVTKWIREVYEKRSKDKVSEDFATFVWSLAVSIYCLGGILGGFTTSLYASYIGRRGGLIVNNLFAIIGGLFMFLSKKVSSPELLILGRLFTGYNNGLNSGLCAMYLVEISTQRLRGAIGSIYQLILTIAIVISQVLGLEALLGTKEHWPILFGLIGIVAILQMILLPFCPESPKYLYVKKGEESSKNALVRLRGSDVDSELAEIKSECAKESQLGKATCSQMLSQKILRKPLMISVGIMLAQQLSGINAVIFYSTGTFTKAGFSKDGAVKATIGMGTMNVLMTVVSTVLVDLLGRKTLLLTGFSTMFLTTVCLGISLTLVDKVDALAPVCVVLVILFVVCFAIGPGSIPWFLVSEFFTQDARPLAASIAVAVNWLANFTVGLTFLPIQDLIGAPVFFIFACLQLIFIIFILVCVPETKNKTYEEISQNFQ